MKLYFIFNSSSSSLDPLHPTSLLLFSLYLGNPMDPPDVLGMESGIARPTKLPNRAKSKSGFSSFRLDFPHSH